MQKREFAMSETDKDIIFGKNPFLPPSSQLYYNL